VAYHSGLVVQRLHCALFLNSYWRVPAFTPFSHKLCEYYYFTCYCYCYSCHLKAFFSGEPGQSVSPWSSCSYFERELLEISGSEFFVWQMFLWPPNCQC